MPGLRFGGDDYLGKPFAFAELVARIRTLGRRSPAPPAVLERRGVRVDSGRREASRAGQPVLLTPKEFSLLEELLRADGNVMSAPRQNRRVERCARGDAPLFYGAVLSRVSGPASVCVPKALRGP
jgi:DNA-binding response OmpR family regulator